jgi:hypothetical protein
VSTPLEAPFGNNNPFEASNEVNESWLIIVSPFQTREASQFLGIPYRSNTISQYASLHSAKCKNQIAKFFQPFFILQFAFSEAGT